MSSSQADIQRYYKFHSKIYDLTRWSFLFGREGIVDLAVQHQPRPERVLEVGVGTGVNLALLCQAYPKAEITAVDLSDLMLDLARKKVERDAERVTFLHQAYDEPLAPGEFDLVVFSYSLSMMNPGWDTVLGHAYADLSPSGRIAVTDFHDSPMLWFKRWMGKNHVRMDGHLAEKLRSQYSDELFDVRPVYAGVWRYFLYVGRKD